MIKTVIFDIQGVIFETGTHVRDRLAGEGYDMKKLIEIGGDGVLGNDYYMGNISYEKYREGVKELFPDSYEYVLTTYLTKYTPLRFASKFFKDIFDYFGVNYEEGFFDAGSFLMIDLIASLSKKYDLALLSGNTKERVMALDEGHNFVKYFKYQVYSDEVHVNKPDPLIYETLLKKMPFQSEECIFFDDRIQNVEEGNKLGIHSFQVPQPV